MAASPRWKIYSDDTNGLQYQAAVKDIYIAAMIVAFMGAGAQIRDGHSPKCIVWREGYEAQSAGESYDYTESVVMERVDALWAKVSGYVKAEQSRVAVEGK